MQSKAVARTVRIAPRKVRLILDLVRGKEVGEAISILKLTNKRSSPVVEKLVKSAVANAEHNYDMDIDNLYISEIYADEGPTLKRFRPRAQGRASKINKRTSHITVVVEEYASDIETEEKYKEGINLGQKINPIGFRVGVIRDWEANWYADKNFASLLHEDLKIRKYIETNLKDASISKVEIERAANRVNIALHTGKPGMVIGKGGSEINKLRTALT